MAVDNTTTANRSASYTIVFQVDLTPFDTLAYPNANGNQSDATLAASRSTWMPTGWKYGDQHRAFKHGDQFTAYDDEAYYLKANFLRSSTNLRGVLTIVSETL